MPNAIQNETSNANKSQSDDGIYHVSKLEQIRSMLRLLTANNDIYAEMGESYDYDTVLGMLKNVAVAMCPVGAK